MQPLPPDMLWKVLEAGAWDAVPARVQGACGAGEGEDSVGGVDPEAGA